jgi:hypothetical protein
MKKEVSMPKQKTELIEERTGVYKLRRYSPPSKKLDNNRLEHLVKNLLRATDPQKAEVKRKRKSIHRETVAS